MADPVSIGIGMMIAGAVVEKQDWFGDKFGEALMLGGAVVAMNPGGAFGGAEAVTAGAGELGAASEIGAAADIPIGLAGPSGEVGLTLGEQGMGAALDSSVIGTEALVPGLDPSASGLLSAAPTVTPPVTTPSMLDSKWAAPGMMVGGQAVTGMMAAKSQEEIEADKIAEEERLRKLKSSWGRTAGGHQVDLNMGRGLTSMSNRFFANRNDPQNKGGLLS